MPGPYEPIRLNQLEVRYLLDADDTDGDYTMFEVHVPVGANVPAAHSHDGFDEAVYGLRGTLTYELDGETVLVTPGTVLMVRRGQVHRFVNQGDEDAAVLNVATPGVFRPQYFQDIAEVMAASAGGPPDIGAIMGVMQRHGLTPVAPAPA